MSADSNSVSHEQKQNNDLLILSSLLVKERPVEISGKVKEILGSQLELKEKIRLIKELDKISDKTTESPRPDTETLSSEKPQEKEESSDYISRPKQTTVPKENASAFVIDAISAEAAADVKENSHRLFQNRKALKPMITSTNFTRYYFSERRKIRYFADKTGIIQFKRFGTKLFLNPSATDQFRKNILPVAEQLYKSLELVLDQGWYYLEKRDYNLVALLHKICREIIWIDFNKLNCKSLNLIDKIASVELLFLILNYDPVDVRELLYAVHMVYSKDPSKIDILKETDTNIHKLLDADEMRPSLYNFIISLNIIKTRTYLELKDLQTPSLQLVNIHEFDCNPQVRDKIDEYLRKLEKGIQPYLDHEKEVYRLHAFIPTDGNGIVDYTLLQNFYDTVLNSRRLTFEFNKENLIKFILNLGNAFLLSFRDILSEKVKLANGENVRLFAQPIFGQDVLRIDFNLKKLDKIQTILPQFPTSRCLSIMKTLSGAIKPEADAIHLITEITSTMVAMGKRLAHILRNSHSSSDENSADKTIPYFSYNENSYTIPGENEKIESEGYLRDFTMRAALFEIAGVCYQTGAFVQHSELADLLAREKKVHVDIHIRVKYFKRIAHEKVFNAFISKYDVPPGSGKN